MVSLCLFVSKITQKIHKIRWRGITWDREDRIRFWSRYLMLELRFTFHDMTDGYAMTISYRALNALHCMLTRDNNKPVVYSYKLRKKDLQANSNTDVLAMTMEQSNIIH